MLHQFLKIIRAGEMQSLLEIARQMDISPTMVNQIADQLARQGYLQEVRQECSSPESTCSDCLASSTCSVAIHRWVLTDKGENVINASHSPF